MSERASTKGPIELFDEMLSVQTKLRRLGEFGNIVDKSDDWYTPAWIFAALGVRFDLDVAAPAEGPRYVPTSRWLSSDGLAHDWSGFVWMNPPYGHEKTKVAWLEKFIEHGNGIALLPDRTSAPWWQWSAPQMDLILFVAPKIKFERPDGSIGEQPGNGTVLMAIGEQAVAALIRAQDQGIGVALSKATPSASSGRNRADATSNPPLSDLSSLRKGAKELDEALLESTAMRHVTGQHYSVEVFFATLDDSERFRALLSARCARIRSALVSGSREEER